MTTYQAHPETVEDWWKLMHPHAVRLEKLITPAPDTVQAAQLPTMRDDLQVLHKEIHDIPCPEVAAPLRESMLRATKQLYHCYEDKQQSLEEVEFYYYNALTQLAQLHAHLVKHGFAS